MSGTMNKKSPPRPKNGREVVLNKQCTILKKDGTTTSVAGYGPQKACEAFVFSMKDNARKLNVQLVGNYIVKKTIIK